MPSPALAGWLRRRARNVRQRPLPAIVVGSAVFVAALLATVIVPGAVDRAAAVPAPPHRSRPDTVRILRHALDARRAAAQADAALAAALAAATAPHGSTSHAPRTRADSLADGITTLDRLDSLLDRAPLPSSYRALGGAWPIRNDPRVRALLDSLDRLERRRAARSAAGGGVDSSYDALTARAAAVGRALRAIAGARRAALRRALGAERAVRRPRRDTAALRRARDSVYLALASARRWLTQARMVDADFDARAARERARAARAAAVPASLLASLALGAVLGFAVAFVTELRHPRVADAAEAEALVGAPVVSRITAAGGAPPRRRAADHEVPPLIEVQGTAYDALYEYMADRTLRLGLVGVTGTDPAATALVSLNLAAAGARRVRSTIVVDADLRHASATRAAGCRAEPGVVEVLAGVVEWAAAVNCVIVGRERTLELLPSGGRHGGSEIANATAEGPGPLLLQLRRRYEAVIVSAPCGDGVEWAAIMEAVDRVLVVVHAAHTSTSELSALGSVLRASGVRVDGIVLWYGEIAPIPIAGGSRRPLDFSVTATEIGR